MTYNASAKITSFTDLRTWQKARKFAVAIYEDTKSMPSDEKFGIVSQMRRSAVSIPANIAEGFSRSGIKEKIQFYHITLGSLTETLSHCYISNDLGYLADDKLKWYEEEAENIHKMVNGMIKTCQERSRA